MRSRKGKEKKLIWAAERLYCGKERARSACGSAVFHMKMQSRGNLVESRHTS